MKIKEKQLKKIQEQQTKLNDLLNKIGVLEANKHGLLHEMAGVNQDIEEFKKELEKEYGAVNINLEDGTYTEINKEEEETPVAAV
tara:strand:+ start:1225 stop:1479 length:255 start_codon:yes stop_codon:yes gene_type:complete